MDSETPENQEKRQIVYRPTNYVGIRSVWEFSEKRNEYVMRKSGNKFIATAEKNGRTKSQSFGSIQDAVKWRSRVKHELEKLPTVDVFTFSEVFERFLENKKSKVRLTTFESYKSIAKHFAPLKEMQIEEINSQTIDKWLLKVKAPEYLAKSRATRETFEHELTLLKLVFSFYTEYINETFVNPVRKRHFSDAVLDHNYVKRKKELAKTRYIPPSDIEKCLKIFAEQVRRRPHVKQIYFMAFFIQLRAGLRIGEVAALRWEDINWQSGLVQITKTVNWTRTKDRKSIIGDVPKNGRFRSVIFIPEVLMALRDFQKSQGRIGGLIFSLDGSRPLAYRSFQHHYDTALKAANVGYTSTHILRHSFATHFLEATRNPIALKAILGHADLRMTEKYAKVTDKTTLEGMEQFNLAIVKSAKT